MRRIRVVLDTEEDVIRDIEISVFESFTVLHESIVKAFNIELGEMASFFVSNQDWEQGEEISLVDFGAISGEARLMENVSLEDHLNEEGGRMIYVYDFLKLWTFFIEVIKVDTAQIEDPEIFVIKGETPKEAPPKSMETVNLGEEYDESDPNFDLDANLEDKYSDMDMN